MIAFLSTVSPSYADMTITLQKVVDVNKESLLGTISDVSEYPQIFPENIKRVQVLDNKTKLVDMDAGINGIFFDTQATCRTDQDGKYVVEVTSGYLKGTTMTTELEKTWGFHGQKDGGTIVNMVVDVKASGLLSWMISFVPESSVSDALSYGFDKFVQHAKES